MEGQLQKAGLRQRKKSKGKAPPPPQHGSDSEASGDSNSNSGDSQAASRSGNDRHKSVTKKGEWEILSGLKQGQRFEFTPNKFEGNLLKRRKWPLKGWHKRYFVIENSVLTYAKNAAELSRGKKHGSMDIGMSVISTKATRRRIDIDADTSIVHLKCQSREVYLQWVEQLKQHRLRKQHQLLYCSQPSALPNLLSPLSPSDDSPTEPLSVGGAGSLTGTLPGSLPGSLPGTLGRDAKPYSAASTTVAGGGTGTLRPWLLDTTMLEDLTGDFAAANASLQQLTRLHQQLQQQLQHPCDPATPSSTKTRRKFRLRKHKSHKSSSVSQDGGGSAGTPTPAGVPISGGLSCPPPLVHQSSLCQPGDRSSTRSEDYAAQHPWPATSMGGSLADLRPLSSSNPALSQSMSSPYPAIPQPPTTPHFFPPSTPHSAAGTTSRPPSCSDSTSPNPSVQAPPCPSPNLPIVPANTSVSYHQFPQVSSLPQLAAPSPQHLPHHQGGSAPPSAPPSINLDPRFASPGGSRGPGGGESPIPAKAEDFTALAKDLLSQLSALYRGLASERDRLQQAADSEATLLATHNTTPASMIAALRAHLGQAVQQNNELRARLARIHGESDPSSYGPQLANASEVVHKTLVPSVSYESSSCFSASEYFDAPEGDGNTDDGDNNSESSSDRSTPASVTTSDASDAGTYAITNAELEEERGKCSTGRRSKLPVPQPNKEDFSLFNFLYKNIGKDLSKVSMPITINEPLNMLQRLCEELEYSELLEKAASLRDPAERMIQVAAFAVSAYASSIHRAAHKPFNPLLGETYECIREDKGFKFVAEQVSHHPPVSACHAQGSSFTLWQDVRIKTKFWGKSLEFQPSGSVHLTLHQHNDVYEWNKVTSCVHNLFGGGTRWVDQYGEAVITNAPQGLTCRLTFVKASGWTSKRHEVFGSITDASGTVLHSLFGRWTEALYCGHAPSARVVWRPGSMPDDARLYYGFTRFAIELNELLPEQRNVLPPTDSRFRPDQRLLEEGRISDAEESKQVLELEQRERRKQREADGTSHVPMWFRREECRGDANDASAPEETWKFNNEYWNKRKDPGFTSMSFESIW